MIDPLPAVLASIAAVVVTALLVRRWVLDRLSPQVDEAEHLAEEAPADRPPREAGGRTSSQRLGHELARLARALDGVEQRLARDTTALEGERRRLEDILEAVPEGVLVAGPRRAPIYANRAFRDLFGVDPAASTAELLALVRRPQVHEAIDRAAAGEPGPSVELQLGNRELSLLARPLQGQAGTLLMVRDVTEPNRLARMRRDFVTNLSHEIKTPLAIIRGAAETLAQSRDDDAAAERFGRRIDEQIYRLEDLLKDLLTLARLESTEAARHRQAVDLAAVCRRAVELLAPLAVQRSVAIRTSIEPVPPLHADAKALERMVLNLLVNGIQYNRKGGQVALRLAAESADEGADQRVVLEVEDNGIGIPAAELPRIFERFYRVDKGRGRGEGGSGLGLAIVKHAAQSHGGTVEVRSDVERGSLFRVVLPAAGPPE